MPKPGRPERNRAARSFRQLRRFHHGINSEEVFGTHREERLRLVERFDDQRLRRLGRRLIYFEAPHLIDETERRAMDEDIAARRRGDGRHSSPQWTTVPGALSELESIGAEIS